MKLSFTCCLCSAGQKVTISPPKGWAHRYGDEMDADEDNWFCPDHAAVAPFAEAQCGGCVGGWGDCPMWSAFSSSYSRTITPDDLATIRRGICPRRVNGTMSIGAGGLHDINLSDRAPAESGEAFAAAIEDYCTRYPVKP